MLRNGIGRVGLKKTKVDYSKTCFHNPQMVFKNTQESVNAFERGESEEKRKQ